VVNKNTSNKYSNIMEMLTSLGDHHNKNIGIVIFIVTYNRYSVLKTSLESYKKLTAPHNIIIINNGTDDEKCVNLLNELSKNYTIYNLDKIKNMDDFDKNVQESLTKYYSSNYSQYYAVTDVDISFENTNNDVLDLYISMIKELKVNVGPELNIDDLPDEYPLKNSVIIHNIYQMLDYYPQRKEFTHNKQIINYHPYPIDSTFTLFDYEQNKIYKRCNNTIRVHSPYSAKHLDWYINILDTPEDYECYFKKQSQVGSWGSSYIYGLYSNLQKNNKSYFSDLYYRYSNLKEVPTYDINTCILSWYYKQDIEKDLDKSNKMLMLFIDSKIKSNCWGNDTDKVVNTILELLN
jgi:hypothetical protein